MGVFFKFYLFVTDAAVKEARVFVTCNNFQPSLANPAAYFQSKVSEVYYPLVDSNTGWKICCKNTLAYFVALKTETCTIKPFSK
jgi:hypothetical protein